MGEFAILPERSGSYHTGPLSSNRQDTSSQGEREGSEPGLFNPARTGTLHGQDLGLIPKGKGKRVSELKNDLESKNSGVCDGRGDAGKEWGGNKRVR